MYISLKENSNPLPPPHTKPLELNFFICQSIKSIRSQEAKKSVK